MSKPGPERYQNSQYSRVMQLKYKSKYKKIKRKIKNFVFENAALCDEVCDIQAKLLIAKEERRFLLKRLMRHEEFEKLERQEQDDNENKQPKKRGPKKRVMAINNNDTSKRAETTDKTKSKTRDCVTIDIEGKPIYPINLGSIIIHSAGEILPINPNFHTTHWIYPVGYMATRIYAHPKDPQRKCVYTCKILNNAGMPQFQVIPDNDLDSVFFGETANSCHQTLLEALQRSLSDSIKQPLQVQGERFFGLGNSTVRTLIQMDAGSKQCANFKGFLENEGAPIKFPLLSDDKDPALSYDALQSLIAMSAFHTMPEVKEEPPDELFDFK